MQTHLSAAFSCLHIKFALWVWHHPGSPQALQETGCQAFLEYWLGYRIWPLLVNTQACLCRVEKYRPCRGRAAALRITGALLLAAVQMSDGFVRLQKHNMAEGRRKIRSRPRLWSWIKFFSSTIVQRSQTVKGRRPRSERNGHFTLCLLFVISSHSWS